MSKYNRPINRDYFKLKKDPNALDQDRFMKCCGSDKDDDGLNEEYQEEADSLAACMPLVAESLYNEKDN